jgi:hypothetical protein
LSAADSLAFSAASASNKACTRRCLDFESLFLDRMGILSDDTHVTFGSLDFLFERIVVVCSRASCFTFFPANRLVESKHRVFEFNQTGASVFVVLPCDRRLPRRVFQHAFRVHATLALTAQEASAFFEISRVAGVDEFVPLRSSRRSTSLTSRRREFDLTIASSRFEPRRALTFCGRVRFENCDQLLWSAEQIADAQVFTNTFA